ncbi:MAG: CPBP family intramembrane glutamic endopeptidase [Planctomycetota bacterium]
MIQLDRDVWRTLAKLFAATYLLQAVAILRGGEESSEFPLWIGASMLLPGIFALLHLRRAGRGWRSIGWRPGHPVYLALALTLPALLTLAGLALFEGTGLGRQAAFWTDASGRVATELPLLLPSESMSFAGLALNVVVTGAVMSLPIAVLTLGEEVGWRGFFQPELLKRNELFKSVVFLGVVWALWHAPLILAGFNYPRTPVLGAFVFFPIAAVGISAWLAWLTLRSGSIWPAALFHAGVNGVGALVFEMDFGERDLLGQSAISCGLLLSGLAALWLGTRGLAASGSSGGPDAAR